MSDPIRKLFSGVFSSHRLEEIPQEIELDDWSVLRFKKILILDIAEISGLGFSLVSIERISQILDGIASFNCGRTQLAQLAQACETRGVKIIFAEGTKEFRFQTPLIEVVDQKIAVIQVPKELCQSQVIYVARSNGEELTFEVCKLEDRIGGQKIESYIMGHELSHVMFYVMCIDSSTRKIDGDKLQARENQIRTTYDILVLSVDFKDEEACSLYKIMRPGGDDVRNLFGLGQDDHDNPIIGEYHYLQEVFGSDHVVRMPYDRSALLSILGFDLNAFLIVEGLTIDDILLQDGIRPNSRYAIGKIVPKTLLKSSILGLDKLDRKLITGKIELSGGVKQDDAIKESHIAFIKQVLQEIFAYHQRAAQEHRDIWLANHSLIYYQLDQIYSSSSLSSSRSSSSLSSSSPSTPVDTFLDKHNLRLQNVPSDGNCGIWAVLKAMDSNADYLSPEVTNEGTGQWEEMMGIRQAAAIFAESAGQPESHTRISGDRTWITVDDIQYVAQTIERPIGIIMPNPYGDNEIVLTAYTADGNIFARNDDETLGDFLTRFRVVNPGALLICHDGINHYQAIMPKEQRDTSPSSSGSDKGK